jgi:putative ABC transport system permease protein
MKAYDLVELATRNLREAVLRNSLTTMGISVGVASLVAMLSLGVGLQKVAGKSLGRSGLFDSIIVSSRTDFRNQEDRTQNRTVQTSDLRTLDDKARKEFQALPNVVEVYPDIRLMAETRFQKDASSPERPHYTSLAALPASSKASEVFDELQGTFFSASNAAEAIVLSEFARELLDLPAETSKPLAEQKLTTEQANALIGKEITIRYAERKANPTPADVAAATESRELESAAEDLGFSVERREKKVKIIGVVQNEPYGGFRGGARGRVFIPTQLAEDLNMLQPTDLRTMMRPSEGKSYFTLVVRVAKSSNVKEVQEAIKKMGFTTFSILDASKGLTRFFTFLDLFLAIFGSLALAVASLGIINTLVMAILERRREIGIMKALGASDSDVKKLFFVEAGTMGVAGGVAGILLGWVIGKVINLGTNIYLERNDIPPENFWYVPLWLVLSALAFAVIVSLASGMYPASRAAKLDPVQALRHD